MRHLCTSQNCGDHRIAPKFQCLQIHIYICVCVAVVRPCHVLTGAVSNSRRSKTQRMEVRPTPHVSLDSQCSVLVFPLTCPWLCPPAHPGMREIFLPLWFRWVFLSVPPCYQILLNRQDKLNLLQPFFNVSKSGVSLFFIFIGQGLCGRQNSGIYVDTDRELFPLIYPFLVNEDIHVHCF